MIRDLGGIPLTDEELDMLVPVVQANVDGMAKLEEVDLAEVLPGHVFHAEPGR